MNLFSYNETCGTDRICRHYQIAKEDMERNMSNFDVITDLTGTAYTFDDLNNKTIFYSITDNYNYYVGNNCSDLPLGNNASGINEANFAPWKYIVNYDKNR